MNSIICHCYFSVALGKALPIFAYSITMRSTEINDLINNNNKKMASVNNISRCSKHRYLEKILSVTNSCFPLEEI